MALCTWTVGFGTGVQPWWNVVFQERGAVWYFLGYQMILGGSTARHAHPIPRFGASSDLSYHFNSTGVASVLHSRTWRHHFVCTVAQTVFLCWREHLFLSWVRNKKVHSTSISIKESLIFYTLPLSPHSLRKHPLTAKPRSSYTIFCCVTCKHYCKNLTLYEPQKFANSYKTPDDLFISWTIMEVYIKARFRDS